MYRSSFSTTTHPKYRSSLQSVVCVPPTDWALDALATNANALAQPLALPNAQTAGAKAALLPGSYCALKCITMLVMLAPR